MLELIFQGFMEWAYGLALECWEYFSSSLLDIMSMDYAYMKSHVPVMVSIAQVLLAVGWALLIGNLVFQALKSMAVGLGFEGEDPKLLFTRTFVFAFLLMASPQICEVGLSLTARIIELLEIPDAINVTLVDEGVFGSLGAAWLLVIIFGLIIMLKVFRLLLEIAERYVILAVLTMTAPLAFAMGGSKSTSEIFGGWCRMFGSMCTLMVTNIIFFKMLLSVLSNVPSGLDIIPWIVLVLTIVKVARKADAIITRIGLNPAITGDSLGRGFPGTLTYMVMRSATSHITKTIGKSTGKGNRGAASGSTTGGPRIGGGPSGAHNAAGHTASYQTYQATQQQNTSQGAEGQGFVSQRESVQSGGAQTATQEHFSSSSMQNTSSIRQAAFRGSEARKSSVPSGMRRAPAYVTSVDRVSPSNAQTPAAGNDTSGNKTTSTVREQSNVTASIRTANSAQHFLSGNASQHDPAGRSPAPVSTRMTQANMQGVRSKVNDRSAQRPEQTENAAAQSIDHVVPAVAQRPSPGSAGISSSPAVSGQDSSQSFGMGTRYTQRPSSRGVSEQKPEAIRPGRAGTSPTQHALSSTVESARSSSGRAAHPASSTQGPIAGSRPDRNIPQGSNVPPNQTRKSNNNPARQEARPIGIRNEPSAKGMFSAQHHDPAGNRTDVSQGMLTRPTTGNRAAASKGILMPSTIIKGSVKNSKEISSSSRKQRREKHERK